MSKQLESKLWLMILTACVCFNAYGISIGKSSMWISLIICVIPLPHWLFKYNE